MTHSPPLPAASTCRSPAATAPCWRGSRQPHQCAAPRQLGDGRHWPAQRRSAATAGSWWGSAGGPAAQRPVLAGQAVQIMTGAPLPRRRYRGDARRDPARVSGSASAPPSRRGRTCVRPGKIWRWVRSPSRPVPASAPLSLGWRHRSVRPLSAYVPRSRWRCSAPATRCRHRARRWLRATSSTATASP